MPDIGVLSLQIHSESTPAESSLRRLEGALLAIKAATSNTGLNKVANALKKINEAFNIQTIVNINGVAAALKKVQDACNFTVPNMSGLNRMRATMSGVAQSAQTVSRAQEEINSSAAGYATAESQVRALQQQLGNTGEKTNEATEQINSLIEYLKKPIDTSQLREYIDTVTGVKNEAEKSAEESAMVLSVPATDADNPFAYASDRILEYTEKINHAKEDLKFWEDQYDKTAKTIKYNGATEERTNMLSHAEEGFMKAIEQIDEYERKIKELQESVGTVKVEVNKVTAAQKAYTEACEESIQKATQLSEQVGAKYDNPLLRNPANLFGNGAYAKALRGDSGEKEQYAAIRAEATNTGQTIEEVQARIQKAMIPIQKMRNQIQELFDALERKPKINLAEGIDRKLNIDGPVKDAKDSAAAFMKAFSGEDNSSMAQQLRELTPEIEGLKNSDGLAVTAEEARKVADEFMNANNNVELLKQRIDSMKIKLGEGIATGTLNEEQKAKIGQQIAILQDRYNKLTDAQNKLAEAQKNSTSFSTRVSDEFDNMKHGISTLLKPLTKLGNQFKNIARRMAIRAIIRQVTSAFREGVENVYHYSDAIGTDFADKMDSAAASLQQMRNSIGAAVAPAIQALIPILQTVVSWVITAINYINQFFALLSGQTQWTRALETATTAYEKSAKQAGGAASDWLADFDELNVMSSGGGGGATAGLTDFSKMFEQVSEFDSKIKDIVKWIKEHMDEIKNVALDIGAAILAWKISNAFSGLLGTLASLALAGIVIKLAFDATVLLDEAYVDSDDFGFLVGDTILTGVLAGISGKLVGAKLGTGAGIITAGITFAVSAGATFSVAKDVEDESKRKMLELLGGAKLGIGAALAAAGFIKSGFNPLLGIVGGIVTVSLVAIISYSLKIEAEEAEKAEEMAKNAFAQTGEGGIKAENYLTALQEEFDKQTAGAKLVLKAYVQVPDLKKKLTEAAQQISSFNQIVFNGDGKLTAEDAAAFKENWGTVIETLTQMDNASYDTILQGLTAALESKSNELRESALEIRKTFIMLEKNITEEDAAIYAEMESISGRLGTDNEQAGDLERYESLYRVFAAATETGFEEIQKALDKGKNIDFGTAETAVANAEAFVKSVGESGNAALKEVQDALDAQTDSVNYMRRKETAKLEAGLITKEVYDERMAALDQVLEVATAYATEKTKAIQDKMNEAYAVIFEQALSADTGTSAFWKTVLNPLIAQAKAAGVELPQNIIDAFTESINKGRIDFGDTGDIVINKIKEQGIVDPKEIAKAINEIISDEFGVQESGFVAMGTNLLVSHSQELNLDEAMTNAKNMINVSGWDMLSKQWKQDYTNALIDAFGEDVTREILIQLAVDGDEIEKLLAHEWSFGGTKLTDSSYFNSLEQDEQVNQIVESIGELIEYGYSLVDAINYYESIGINDDVMNVVREMAYALHGNNAGEAGTPGTMPRRTIFSDWGYSGNSLFVTPNGGGNGDTSDTEKAVENGTRNGTSGISGQMAVVQSLLRNILTATQQRIVITPNTSMGRAASASMRMYNNVTGNDPHYIP